MTKRGRVSVNDRFAGIIEEFEGECVFTYDLNYLKDEAAPVVSLTLPKRIEPYREKTMIPFFDGLILEGWLLDILRDNWKLDPRDRMSLLLFTCKDCIGNVSVVPEE
jgi:serine/threonine-protein kinase HipA